MPTNLLWICLTCPRRARGQKPRASYGKWAKPLTEGHGKTQCFRHFSVSLRPRSGDAAPACPGFLTRCLAKLLEQRLERGEEAEALPRRQVVREHDLLQLGIPERVEVEVPRQVAA